MKTPIKTSLSIIYSYELVKAQMYWGYNNHFLKKKISLPSHVTQLARIQLNESYTIRQN
jgi:hypothetical protein